MLFLSFPHIFGQIAFFHGEVYKMLTICLKIIIVTSNNLIHYFIVNLCYTNSTVGYNFY